jgi:HlyD family secretion protein
MSASTHDRRTTGTPSTKGRSKNMRRGKTTVLFAVIAFLGGGAVAATARSNAQPVQVDLNFKDPGVLTDVLVRPGERVQQGQVLARIDDGEARANLQTAEAGLAAARASLRQLSEGMSPAEKAQARVAQEQAAATADAAGRASSDAQNLLAQTSQGLQTDVTHEQSRLEALIATAAQNKVAYQAAVDQARAQLEADHAKLQTSQTDLDAARAQVSAAQTQVDAATAQLAQDQAAYDQAGCAARPSDPDCQALAATIQGDRQRLADAKTELAAATDAARQGQSSVADAQDKVRLDAEAITNALNAQAAGLLADQQAIDRGHEAVEDAQNAGALGELQGKQQTHSAEAALRAAVLSERATEADTAVQDQPPRPSALAIARSDVETAKAAVELARIALEDTVLRAPSDGIVVAVNNEVGEVAGSSGSTDSSGVFLTLAIVPSESGGESP